MSSQPSLETAGRIPTLDGWRGIAILLVLIDHYQLLLFHGPYRGHWWLLCGQHGVTLFFVLSGYLITGRLLKEERIDLKKFYIRRFFRLMPCAWLYLLSLGLMGLILHGTFIGRDAWSCVFFFRNYWPRVQTDWNVRTGHFWSLSLEEQFYLAWPPLLALIGRKWSLRLAVAGIGACAMYRFYHWQQYHDHFFSLHTEVRIDALLFGCALAMALEHAQIRDWLARNSVWIVLCSLPLTAWYIHSYSILIPAGESMLLALMIACTSLNPSFLLFRALEWKHLKFLGLISYSLYVWQQSVLFSYGGFPYGAFLLPVVAILSYALIERPCIEFGRRISVSRRKRFETALKVSA
jgi:peptidoglycan/LPS O-acetylase OafA/YrhL